MLEEGSFKLRFTFVTHPGVASTNNRAERAQIAEHVVQWKIVGTLRNRKGTSIHERIMTVETIKVEDLIFENHWRYLDVAFLDFIWKQWKLSKIFPQSDGKDVQTSEIVEILTLYHCLDPGSYLSAVDWFNKTALDRILRIDGQHINKSKIFRELDMIEDRKEDIERYLYKALKKRDEDSMHIVFYTSYRFVFRGAEMRVSERRENQEQRISEKESRPLTSGELQRLFIRLGYT